jgi:hypothetical protein
MYKNFFKVVLLCLFGFCLVAFRVLALDEYDNKFKIKKTIELPNKQPLVITVSSMQFYEGVSRCWPKDKYGLALGTDLTKWLSYTCEYRYVYRKSGRSGSQLENNFGLFWDLPKDFSICDENKLINELRECESVYENEFELSRKVLNISSEGSLELLINNVADYDFSDHRFCDDTLELGFLAKFNKNYKLKFCVGRDDIVGEDKSASIIETVLTYSF